MHFAWLIIVFILSGCATISDSPSAKIASKPSDLHKLHMANLSQIKQFSIKGRIGVITQPKNFTAKMLWQHLPETDNIDIYSPLGSKVANITKTSQQVSLTDNKQKVLYAEDAETLTREHLGFSLPLSGLSYWAIGKPNHNSIAEMVTWDQYGRVDKIIQEAWNIEYKDYVDFEGYLLPKKITLTNEKITLKLIVDEWSNLASQLPDVTIKQ